MNPKGVVVLVLYMILIYTTVHVFTYSTDTFVMGGSNADLLVEGDVDPYVNLLGYLSSENLSGGDAWAECNSSFGAYLGHWWTFDWLDSGDFHWWRSDSGVETKIPDWKFQKILAGTITYNDMSFQESAGQVLGSVWDAIGYVVGLLTFNVAEPEFSDGSAMPAYLTWFPLLLVLVPWIIITYWLLPVAIRVVRAIGALIPFT